MGSTSADFFCCHTYFNTTWNLLSDWNKPWITSLSSPKFLYLTQKPIPLRGRGAVQLRRELRQGSEAVCAVFDVAVWGILQFSWPATSGKFFLIYSPRNLPWLLFPVSFKLKQRITNPELVGSLIAFRQLLCTDPPRINESEGNDLLS